MRIPPYYEKPQWQRILAGMAIGGIISWCIFLYIFGEWQEDYSKRIKIQAETIRDLTEEKKIWQEDVEKLNKKNEELLRIQKIEVKITNSEKYKLDPFSIYEMEEAVKKDIETLLGKDIETAFKSRDLIKKTIENETHITHEKRYRLQINEMIFFSTLSIQLSIHLDG
jgi:hypothetical protein